jgi:hypothetical protein
MGTTLVSRSSATLGLADAIARTAVEREQNHRLPHEEIAIIRSLLMFSI